LELVQGEQGVLLDLQDTELEHNNWWLGLDQFNNEYRVYYGGSGWIVQQTQESGASSILIAKEATASAVPEDGIYELENNDAVAVTFTFNCYVDHACDYMLLTDLDTLEEDIFDMEDSEINEEYWWSGTGGTISYNSGRWVVQDATGVEFHSAMYEDDFPQNGDYQATSGDVAVKNFGFTCYIEEPTVSQRVFTFDGDYATEVEGREEEFLRKCTAAMRGTCVEVTDGSGSILVTVEGTETELDADEAELTTDGLELDGFTTLYLDGTSVCDSCMSEANVAELQELADDNALLIAKLQEDLLTLQQGIQGWQDTLEGTEDTAQNMETCFTGYLQNREDYVYTTTTKEPTEATTEAPGYILHEDLTNFWCEGSGNTGGDRTFQIAFNGVERCADRCRADADCIYFSIREDWNLCQGCAAVPSVSQNNFQTYEVIYDDRRALSDETLASLQEENAVLKNALHQHLAAAKY